MNAFLFITRAGPTSKANFKEKRAPNKIVLKKKKISVDMKLASDL